MRINLTSLAGRISNLVVVGELLVGTIAIGFVAAMLALAQVIVFAFVTYEGHRRKLTALV